MASDPLVGGATPTFFSVQFNLGSEIIVLSECIPISDYDNDAWYIPEGNIYHGSHLLGPGVECFVDYIDIKEIFIQVSNQSILIKMRNGIIYSYEKEPVLPEQVIL